jgi:hypothetical protein
VKTTGAELGSQWLKLKQNHTNVRFVEKTMLRIQLMEVGTGVVGCAFQKIVTLKKEM